MAFLTTENASSSSSVPPSSTPGCIYEHDVFLSFRGTDTRNNFTDHLYYRLKQVGISTFRDDERLEQGTEINSGLLRAIDESKIAVVVLSKQYASSSWCLMELAKIVECMDKKKLTVLPVFHYVDPSDVRNQRSSFAEAFAKHENRFEDDDVKTWRAALTEVASLSGWHLKDNSESEVIKEIIQRINSELDREVPLVSEHLVGMDSRVKELLDLCLAERLDCVRLVGICGMGGIDRSLITIKEYGTLWMHDLLQKMGQEIVRREFPEEPSRRSRLWSYEDVLHVLTSNAGTEAVKGIMLNMPIEAKERLSSEAFSKMKILRFLKIGYVYPPRDRIGGPIQLPQGLSYLSNELRVIDWHGYPLKSMPTSFQPNKLVELRMRYSDIKQLWKGIMMLNELKLIDLSDSQNLIEIPDLSGAPNLKQLILQRCTRLYNIHASLGDLKRLIRLDLNGCKCLKSLPHKINLEALKFFNLSGCSKLKKFPYIVENMPRLWKLYLSETAIKDLSLLVIHSTGLKELDLRDCKNLSSLPIAICRLMSLKTLNLSGCSKLDELPENLGKIEGLEKLDLSGTAITSLPSSIVHLKNLKVLSVSGCVGLSSNKLTRFLLMQPRRSLDPMGMLERSLIGLCSLTELNLSYCNFQTIPNVLGCLSSLKSLDLSGNDFVCLPESIIQLSNLTYLDIGGCTHLRMLPKLPLNIQVIDATECTSLETLMLGHSLKGLCSLDRLYLSYCNIQTIPNDLGCLSSLRFLTLDGNNFVSLPESIIQLSNLKYLFMGDCPHLEMLPKLPLNIEYIDASNCTTLETLSLRPESDFKPSFCLLNCDKLIKNQGYGDLFSTMLRHYITQGSSDSSYEKSTQVVIPGSEIPKWFSHQNVGASVNLQRPSDLLGNKLMGIVVCAVFVIRKRDYEYFYCSIGSTRSGTTLSHQFGKIESYQLWLEYFSSRYPGAFEEELNKVDANGFSQIEVKFEPDPGLEVTKCGAHLVFERDIEDLINQIKAGPSSCIISPYDEDGFEDSEKETKIKRSRDDSDEEGAGPSGEATSNDVDEPHPKSVQLPNLIQRLMLCFGNWIGSLCAQRQGDSDCEKRNTSENW